MHLYHYSGFYLKHQGGVANQNWMDGDYRSEEKIASTLTAREEIANSMPDWMGEIFTLVSFTYLYEIEE